MVWVVATMVVGTVSAACSGTTTGTDLTGNGGNGNGGPGGGLLGSVGGANNGGASTGSNGTTTQQTSGTTPTKTSAPAPTQKGAGVCGSGDSTGNTACDACLDPKCCTSINACNGNPECIAEFDCAKACNGDRECGTQCRQEHPQGDADLQAFIACVQGNCEAACQ